MGRTLLYGVDARDFRAQIRAGIPTGQVTLIDAALAVEFAQILQRWLNDVIEQVLRETSVNDNGGLSKALRASPRISGIRSLRTLAGRVWVHPWVYILEEGGTVRPKKSKYLTIPFAHGLRQDGVTPKFRKASSWRRFGSFVYTSKTTGTKFLAYKNAQGQLLFLYVLVDSVNIPAQLGFKTVANREIARLYALWGQAWIQVMFSRGLVIPPDLGGLEPGRSGVTGIKPRRRSRR